MPVPDGALELARPLRHPATGELFDLATIETDQLARARAELIDLRHRLDEFSALLDAELVPRMDRENTHTLRAGGYKLVSPPATVVDWNEAQLSMELQVLVDTGRLSQGAANKALKRVVEYKPQPGELKKLMTNADPEVRRAIEACRDERPNLNRRVKITPERNITR